MTFPDSGRKRDISDFRGLVDPNAIAFRAEAVAIALWIGLEVVMKI